ncbi:hypothetical protein [Flavobacterium sp. AED]|uniref:hypothetical protein n=1 Tax=Flavobacterium sp. AED TaxID=1423323 RepID=UPI00057DE7F0|nr:hypothetical protein [Flavobacterium sp. AED]KIA87177.1 hypothetical protein OA85_06095 [Flavobacterium sp. AED]
MKKKLEADLISIAHRILQLKNKSDINQLYLETQKLYEKLSVLRFVDEHFSDAKPTIGIAEIEQKIEEVFDQKETAQPETKTAIEETIANKIVEIPAEQNEETPVAAEEIIFEETIETPLEEKEEIVTEKEPTIEEEIVAEEEDAIEEEITAPETAPFLPAFELSEEEEVEEEKAAEIETPKKMEAVQISFEDLLGGNYSDAQFVKVHPLENIPTAIAIDFEEKQLDTIEEVKPEPVEPKTASLNEKLAKNINIDLNDRIAFTKHLFGNSSEDYNRVLNQLITFDTFYETRDFIQEMVKPDYNNWEGKQDYEERFMDIIEKKFL